MFKNKAIQLKMVNAAESETQQAEIATLGLEPEEISEILQDQIVAVGITVGGVVLAAKALDIFGQIVVHIAKTKIK